MPTINLPLLLESGYWFNGSPGPATPITFVLLAIFAIALGAGIYVWRWRRKLFPGQRIKTRLAAHLGPWFVGVAATGIVLMVLRIVEFPILSGRILWLACLIGLVGILTYVAWYMTRRYESEMARLARAEARQRWVPKPKARRSGRRR